MMGWNYKRLAIAGSSVVLWFILLYFWASHVFIEFPNMSDFSIWVFVVGETTITWIGILMVFMLVRYFVIPWLRGME